MKKTLLTAVMAATTLTAWCQIPAATRLLTRELPTATMRVMPAPAAPLNPLEGDQAPVTTRPEGTSKLYSRGSQSYESMSGYIVEKADRGLAVEVITEADGKTVWMNNVISKFYCDAWLKGELDSDGVITFKLSQPLSIQVQNGQRYTYYATRMYFDPETNWFYATDNQEYKFKIDGEKIEPLEPGYLLGLTVYTIEPGTSDYFYSWLGFGDYNIFLTENHDVTNSAPEGLDMELYGLVYLVDGHEINVGFDDEKNVWVQGMLRSLPYAWTKGTPVGDGKYEFKSEQFLGIDPITRHFTYFMGGKTERRFVESESAEMDVQVALPAYTAIFDSDNKRFQFIDDENILITTNTTDGSDGLAFIYLYKTPVLQYQDRKAGVAPKAPVFTGILPFNSATSYGGVSFDLPRVDVDDMLIDAAGLEYEMYIDGELFTFYPDEYRSLRQPTTRIGYYYSDGLDFMCQGVDHIVYYFIEGAETLGVRNVYKEGGKEIYSDITTVSIDTSVESVEAVAATPVAEELYTLDGRRAADEPEPGIYVVRTRYSDGSVKTTKQVRK